MATPCSPARRGDFQSLRIHVNGLTRSQVQTDIDITFDVRLDTPEGKDPDVYSKTLRRYHKLLWSKPLPGGQLFELDDATPGSYLHHRSDLGEFFLASDTVIPTFKWDAQIKELIPDAELKAFNAAGYTIGGMMVFPGNQIDGKWTINQARGCTRAIGDRFDLTLECIRRHYSDDETCVSRRASAKPLMAAIKRYADFFALFRDFRGYVEFFLLEDLVSADFSTVRISEPFDDFKGSPIPSGAHQYNAYKTASVAFIAARNQRIMASG
jgi:hypothetical protein